MHGPLYIRVYVKPIYIDILNFVDLLTQVRYEFAHVPLDFLGKVTLERGVKYSQS